MRLVSQEICCYIIARYFANDIELYSEDLEQTEIHYWNLPNRQRLQTQDQKVGCTTKWAAILDSAGIQGRPWLKTKQRSENFTFIVGTLHIMLHFLYLYTIKYV